MCVTNSDFSLSVALTDTDKCVTVQLTLDPSSFNNMDEMEVRGQCNLSAAVQKGLRQVI
jgi:hypothetical protein